MKLCKDCKHYAGPDAAPECTNSRNVETDYVNGGEFARYNTATALRVVTDLCGHEARWFEPKGAA